MTRCDRCPVPAGARCASDRHPLFCQWAGDPILDRAIQHASGHTPPVPPRPAPPPTPPLTLMAAACLYRAQPGDTGCSTCRGVRCWADRGNREGGRACTLAHCEACSGELVPYRRT